jgi:hypothetical protein
LSRFNRCSRPEGLSLQASGRRVAGRQNECGWCNCWHCCFRLSRFNRCSCPEGLSLQASGQRVAGRQNGCDWCDCWRRCCRLNRTNAGVDVILSRAQGSAFPEDQVSGHSGHSAPGRPEITDTVRNVRRGSTLESTNSKTASLLLEKWAQV